MEYKAIQKNLGHTPRKMRLVADMIRKMTPEQALEILQFTNKSAAADLAKAIKTAIANSSNKSGLTFKKIEINEGIKLKRFRYAGRGRIRPYKKRFSHIKIILTDEVITKKQNTNNEEKGVEQIKVRPDDSAAAAAKAKTVSSESVR